MGEHTPTPWGLCHHMESPEHDASCPCGYRGGIWSADGSYVVLEMGASPDRDEAGNIMGQMMPQADRATQLADAAFIVRACNSHDDLVAALEALLFNAVHGNGLAAHHKAQDAARAAIAKAKGQP